MSFDTLSEWLEWQESLNVREIDLGLERVSAVADRLGLKPPTGKVFTIAGTNGKGSCAHVLDALLTANGLRTGLYTSPHLVRYNERVRVAGEAAGDDVLMRAFERIEAARHGQSLTFFEYGTLAAFIIFTEAECDAWVLEVGLGGRLDAVNVIDADFAVITTVALDHMDWLGDSVEKIAREKAGVMRTGKPVFYGDYDVPESIRETARETGAPLHCLGEEYAIREQGDTWSWSGAELTFDSLSRPHGVAEVQIRNQGLALAVCEEADPVMLSNRQLVKAVLASQSLPGRMQIYHERHEWILDVAHNPQAAASLATALRHRDRVPTCIVLGMMADKAVELFAAELAGDVSCWITCDVAGGRGSSAAETAGRLQAIVGQQVMTAGSVEDALGMAQQECPEGGRIVVCGSFYVVGPAIEWLGLY